ncbi:MAG: cell cycle protein [Anaerolineaceae bacterium]|nr:MAG: cell cycle protein [Anaerolineaceae bacterium]
MNIPIQRRLMTLAAVFLFLYSVILTLAPAARERSWDVDYRWSHWLGFAVWAAVFGLAHLLVRRRLPDADPYLLPAAALLAGWGLLTIWRLVPGFGAKQTIWLAVCGTLFLLGLRLAPDLHFLRRYKYAWLTGGLLLTALTLVFGTNPMGGDQRLWLGAFGVYFQPSEPLKLLLIVYLAAWFADRIPFQLRPLALFVPTAAVTGLALLLLFVQRDLGAASIFIFLYTAILFLASGKKRVLLASLAGLALAGVAAYFLFDVVRIRVDAWLNPWLDPSGRSYQIVQALLAVANGGLLGRGPGMGSPGLVPVAISDFVFSAIAEETGLAGTLGLLLLIGIFAARGIITALRAPDRFRRILAAGLTAYLGAQSILIIGGNLRVLPLTGVTLPFVSYGGSSLLTSLAALLLLLLISARDEEPAPLPNPRPYLLLGGLLGLGLLAAALANGWWAVVRGPDLLTRTDNARRAIADRYVQRGSLLDRNGEPVNATTGTAGDFVRVYAYPDLAPVAGYTSPAYGQAGLEASLDPYLRGLQGNPASLIWFDHLFYGQPPPGLDVRLSLDLDLQRRADSLLGNHAGVIVLLDAQTGEILAMASHPTFDPSTLDADAPQLNQDPATPLLDRAAQGMYPPGGALSAFLQASGLVPDETAAADLTALYAALGFYTAPDLRLPVAESVSPADELRVSPLQMALAAAALSNDGVRPAPRLAMAVDTPAQGWVVLPALSDPVQAFPAEGANQTADALMVNGQPFWEWVALVRTADGAFAWYLGGTLPDWQGTPLAVVVLLEEDSSLLAQSIGRALLKLTVQP